MGTSEKRGLLRLRWLIDLDSMYLVVQKSDTPVLILR